MLAIYAETFRLATLTGAHTSALPSARTGVITRSERAVSADRARTDSWRAGGWFSAAQALKS